MLPPINWPDACNNDECPFASICVFRPPSRSESSPFTCFHDKCDVNCKTVLANGGSCSTRRIDGDLLLNSTETIATTTLAADQLVCNVTSSNGNPNTTYPAISPCSYNSTLKCELCQPTQGVCNRDANLSDFCTPYKPCQTPNTYCLSAGVVVTGSLRCVPFECGTCGGELSACVVEVFNASTAPVFAGCVSTRPSSVLVSRIYSPATVAVWRTARLDLARGFNATDIVRDMHRIAALLGGFAEHVRVRNILTSNDDSIGDPLLVGAATDADNIASALGAVSVVFQMPAPMLYNLEMLLLVPTSEAALQLKSEFGIVGIVRTDWIPPVPATEAPSAASSVRLSAVVTAAIGAAAALLMK
jgi:hypothetical protein